MKEIVGKEAFGGRLLYEPMPGKIKGSVIICAGGGYEWLSPREEWPVAHAFAAGGYQAYILKYDVGDEKKPLGMNPVRQLAWAVRTVRELNDGLTVVCGFSAGGHVCSMLGVHWDDESVISQPLQEASRPDGMILGYPLTSVTRLDDKQRIAQLLLDDDAEGISYMDAEGYVSKHTPPVFVWHTVTDEIVPVTMTLGFTECLLREGVYTEMHLYPDGAHGLSLATPQVEEPEKNRFSDEHVAGWFESALQWLEKLQKRENTA